MRGGYDAIDQAGQAMLKAGSMSHGQIDGEVAAISCGIYKGKPVLDLDYAEDSDAGTGANFVIRGDGGIVEIQGTAEGAPFSEDEFAELMRLAKKGIGELVAKQKDVLGIE